MNVDDLAYKIRIAALWILFIIAFFIYRTLALGAGATEVSMLDNTGFASMMLALMLLWMKNDEMRTSGTLPTNATTTIHCQSLTFFFIC